MKIKAEKTSKIFLAVLLLLCLAEMPYGFYQFVRFIALIGFSALAYLTLKQSRQIEMILYIVLAILFQPFVKIALGRELWNIIDIIVAAGLIISLFVKDRK